MPSESQNFSLALFKKKNLCAVDIAGKGKIGFLQWSVTRSINYTLGKALGPGVEDQY